MTSIIADYEFIKPSGSKQLAARDRLLVESLRPGKPENYPIAAEYPLVLGPAMPEHSICVTRKGVRPEDGGFLAHANLWMRKMAAGESRASMPVIKLALVGNVATDKNEQGKGWMRTLLGEIEREARAKGADAILLWSDLTTFYAKMGFEPGGSEFRIMLSAKELRRCGRPMLWVPDGYRTGQLPVEMIQRMMQLRSTGFNSPFFQVERSVEEFVELLKIPELALFVGHGESTGTTAPGLRPVDFFFVVGKGMDMQGVIHEWGTTDMNLLMGAAGVVAEHGELEEIMILVPPAIKSARIAALHRASKRIEQHAMAWVKPLNPETKPLVERMLHEGFIWGLDSI